MANSPYDAQTRKKAGLMLGSKMQDGENALGLGGGGLIGPMGGKPVGGQNPTAEEPVYGSISAGDRARMRERRMQSQADTVFRERNDVFNWKKKMLGGLV